MEWTRTGARTRLEGMRAGARIRLEGTRAGARTRLERGKNLTASGGAGWEPEARVGTPAAWVRIGMPALVWVRVPGRVKTELRRGANWPGVATMDQPTWCRGGAPTWDQLAWCRGGVSTWDPLDWCRGGALEWVGSGATSNPLKWESSGGESGPPHFLQDDPSVRSRPLQLLRRPSYCVTPGGTRRHLTASIVSSRPGSGGLVQTLCQRLHVAGQRSHALLSALDGLLVLSSSRVLALQSPLCVCWLHGVVG